MHRDTAWDINVEQFYIQFKEANGELTWDETDVSTQSWNLKEVGNQFSELYSWLRILQELVYSKEENLLDKSLRAVRISESDTFKICDKNKSLKINIS